MKCLLIPFFCLFVCYSFAQENDFIETVQIKLNSYNNRYIPEYIDLVCDRDLYLAGDKIWFSFYLSNKDYTSKGLSTIVYVEIKDKNDSVVVRQRIKSINGRGHGDLTLPDRMITGYYKLIAYTLWMKNTGDVSYYNKFIAVVNSKEAYPTDSVAENSEKKNEIKLIEQNTSSLKISLSPVPNGNLIAYTRNKIFYHQAVDDDTTVIINTEEAKGDNFYVSLLNGENKIISELLVRNDLQKINVSLEKSEIKPRSGVEITIELKDNNGDAIGADLVVLLQKKQLKYKAQSMSSPQSLIHFENRKSLAFKKEYFVLPHVAGWAKTISFSGGKTFAPYSGRISDKFDFSAISNLDAEVKTMNTFGQDLLFDSDETYNLPYDIIFNPHDYSHISSLSDFFKEVIPQVKVKSSKDFKEIRVRNSENSSKVYYFKDKPLLMIDGFIINSAIEFLNFPISDIENVKILWTNKKMNDFNVFSLADNGVVAITSKSQIFGNSLNDNVLKDLTKPSLFSLPFSKSNEISVPVFLYPLYWNPSFKLNGKAKLSFVMPDQLGAFLLIVQGYTESGKYVYFEKEVTSSLN